MSKPKRSLIRKLNDKYRLIIYNDNTFEELAHLRLSAFNLAWVVGLLSFILIAIVLFLVAYTDIKELIPGYPDPNMRRSIVENAIRLDSLEKEIELRDRYMHDLAAVISGEAPQDAKTTGTTIDSSKLKNIKFSRSKTDSLFRKQIEEEEQFNLAATKRDSKAAKNDFARFYFFKPVNGVVTNKFNAKNHTGIDIATAENTVIKSVLDGTVILATWTIETGYLIQIQHPSNLISVYKHCAVLFKTQGAKVNAGEPIGIVGNTGELTTGPHLHLELWRDGQPINAEDYIVF